MTQGGGQAGGPAGRHRRPRCRSQIRRRQFEHGARAHAGRRADGRRRRRQPDPLRRRAPLRRHEAPRPRSSPRAPTSSPQRSASSAEEAGVPIALEPAARPRALRATSSSARRSPRRFFAAVAEVLAFVYRTAGRRAQALTGPRRAIKRAPAADQHVMRVAVWSCRAARRSSRRAASAGGAEPWTALLKTLLKHSDLAGGGRGRPRRRDDARAAADAAARPLRSRSNIAGALVILIATMYVPRALDFAAFPSLLLLTTLFRLALNVSVTRLDPAARRRRQRHPRVRLVRRRRQPRRRPRRLPDPGRDPVRRDHERRRPRRRGRGALHPRRDARQADGDRRRPERRPDHRRARRASAARRSRARPTSTARWTAPRSSSRATRSRAS